MTMSSRRWISIILLSLALFGGAQPGRAQSGMMPGWGGLAYDGLPEGARLQAGGSAFFGLTVPTRTVYVGQAVPVEIAAGILQGLPATLKGLPLLKGSGFTLNKLAKRTDTRKTYIQGHFFDLLTWHTAISAVKPGAFALSAGMPLTVATSRPTARNVVIDSAPFRITVLPLPVQGRPEKFSGAIGTFRVSSDISSVSVKQGEPLTLRLHVRGEGNFERVDSGLFDHLANWKTYPAKAVFTPSDVVGNRGEKVFEQALIATASGEQTIPAIEFDYFNPSTRRYVHARTSPIKVSVIAAPLALPTVRPAAQALARAVATGAPAALPPAGLRPDHRPSSAVVGDLRPLHFQGPFLALLAALALLLPAAWIGARPNPARARSRAAARALARLQHAACAGDMLSFFDLASRTLRQTLAARWQMPVEHISATELRARLGTAGEEIERLLATADEARYAGAGPSGTDLQRWLGVVRSQLAGERQ